MKSHNHILSILFVLSILSSFISCSENSDNSINESVILDEFVTGGGYFEFSDFQSLVIKTYYHIPIYVTNNTPIVFVFHGAGRNAKDYRDAMIAKANQFNFIVIVPEFSIANFPGGDGYNLGNVFIDGDNPSIGTLNPEDEWAFSVIEPLFDFIKQSLNNFTPKYHIFGHSAGGQFAHRFMMFKPNARFYKVVSSGSGWYTVPDLDINFPYGFKNSPLEDNSFENLFEKQLTIQIGELDNDPNSAGLRHNQFADAQGLNRLERANHFFDEALQLSQENNLEFNWDLHINEEGTHNYLTASESAANLIFN
jgi:pimeloyl-ACP methyl ester carboxylesterase